MLQPRVPTRQDMINLIDNKIGGFKIPADDDDQELRKALVEYGQALLDDLNEGIAGGDIFELDVHHEWSLSDQLSGFINGWEKARGKVPA